MPDVAQLLQALLSPSIFVSATGLLLLSLNARLMGIVSRLRQLHREARQSAGAGRAEEAAAFSDQIISVERRAEKIRRAFLCTLFSLAGTVITCLLLGLGLYWQAARLMAIATFVGAILALLVAALYYIAEVHEALSAVREEARFFQLVDAGTTDRRRSDPSHADLHGGI
jgi:uncharacterized membrane protein (GlpM family)